MNTGGFLRRNAVGIVLVAGFSGCTSIVFNAAYQHATSGVWRSNCQSNLKLIGMACQQYRADYGGQYPPLSDGGSRGWTNLVASYERVAKFSCPAGYESSFSPSSDYFFNAQLAIHRSSGIQDPVSTIAFGDGPDNGPSNSHYWEIPNDFNNGDSTMQRHIRNSNYAFADGHVHSLRPDQFREWLTNETGKQERRYKFAPDSPTWRTKPPTNPTPNAKTKRLHEPNHAAAKPGTKN